MLGDRGTHVRSPNYWFHTSQVFSAAANSVYLWQQWRQRRQSDIYRSSQKVNETHPWWVSGELAVRSWEALSQSAPRRQRAVTAYLTSEQLPPCRFRRQNWPLNNYLPRIVGHRINYNNKAAPQPSLRPLPRAGPYPRTSGRISCPWQTRDRDPVVVYCWASVADAGPTIIHHVSRLVGLWGQILAGRSVTAPN